MVKNNQHNELDIGELTVFAFNHTSGITFA